MKKFQKTVLTLGTAASAALPVAAVVSCGSDAESFDPAKKDSIIQLVGPNGHADKSFQEQAWNGLIKAKEQGYVNHVKEVKASNSDTAKNKEAAKAAIAAGAYTIFGNGEGFTFLNDSDFAGANPGREFLITDASVASAKANVTAVTFPSHKAAYKAAIGAAFYMTEHAAQFGGLNDLKVGFWGGAEYVSVDAFIAGFIDGINYFNATYAKEHNEIKIVNSDMPKAQSYSGSWGLDTNSHNMVETLVSTKEADLLFPVAGGQVAEAVNKAKSMESNSKHLLVVGVDADQSQAYGADGKYFVTSAVKNVDVATHDFLEKLHGSIDSTFTVPNTNGITLHANNVYDKAVGVVDNKFKDAITATNYKASSITGTPTIKSIVDALDVSNVHTQWAGSGTALTTS